MSASRKTTNVGDVRVCDANCCQITGVDCTWPQCFGCVCDGLCLCLKSNLLYCKIQEASKSEDGKLCTCAEGGCFCVMPSTCIQMQQQLCCLDNRCALPCTEQVPCIFTCLPGCIVCAAYKPKVACCAKVKDVIDDCPESSKEEMGKEEFHWDLTDVDVAKIRVVDACCCSICGLNCQFPECIGVKTEGVCVCCQAESSMCKPVSEENDDKICCVLCDGGSYIVVPSTCVQCTESCCCIDSRCALPCTDKVPCIFTCLPGCVVGAAWHPKFACCPLIEDIIPDLKTVEVDTSVVPSQEKMN